MNLLIVYGTTEGHTRKICEFLQDEARKTGHDVKLADATSNPPDPGGFDAVIIGSSLHAGSYQTAIHDYVKEHKINLNTVSSAFLSVSLTAAANEPESWKELEEHTDRFLTDTGWEPEYLEQVAGALLYTKYDFFKRFIMRLISKRAGGDSDVSRDYEYTDWDQVRGLLHKLEKTGTEKL